jgi:hypothetical protein
MLVIPPVCKLFKLLTFTWYLCIAIMMGMGFFIHWLSSLILDLLLGIRFADARLLNWVVGVANGVFGSRWVAWSRNDLERGWAPRGSNA